MQNTALRQKTVLVTGADGFIGSHLTEMLTKTGASVRALSQYNSFGTNGWLDRIDPDIRNGIDIRNGDIRDPHFVGQLVEGCDVVLHLAALIAIPFSYVAPQSYVDVNVTGTLNVLEACRREQVSRLVHTSTSEVYGTALFTPITEKHPLQGQSPYSASKIGADHMVEAYVRSFELPAVILRPFNTFGPRQSERAVIPTVIRQFLDPDCDTVRIGDLSPIRDFNFVLDIADAFIRVAASDKVQFGRAYNAASGQSVRIGEMIDIVRDITGSEKPVEAESKRIRPAKSEVFELLGDASQLTDATGWTSEIGLKDGLSATVEWWTDILRSGQQRRDQGYQV